MDQEIRSYFLSKKWRYAESGNEIRLYICPFCDSDSRNPFCINTETGKAICHKCGWAGSFSTLKASQGDLVRSQVKSGQSRSGKKIVLPPKELAEKCHSAFMQKPDLVEKFCEVRCLTPDTLKKFKIGIDVDENRGISYPFYEKGELVAIKFKRKNKQGQKIVVRWKLKDADGNPVETAGTKAALFNVDSLKGNRVAYVCEGEDDCMLLTQYGLENVVSIPNGANATRGEFLDALEPFQDIIIVFDNDRSGMEGAEKLAETLGKYKCRIATLPEGIMVPSGPWGPATPAKDVTDFCRASAIDVALAAIDDAPAYKNEAISHVSDYIDELEDEFFNGARDRGRSTGFPTLDGVIGGRRNGELIVISGNTGSGKSSFVLNESLQIAQMGEGVLMGSFEQTIPAVLRKMSQMISGKWFHIQDDETGQPMTKDDMHKVSAQLRALPLYFVNAFGAMEVEQFNDCASYAKRRLNAPTAILDHLHFMLRVRRGEDERQAIDRAMLDLKQGTIDHDLSSWVVCHPKQKSGEDNPILNLNDFRGSSFISQIADLALVVWRDRNTQSLRPEMGRAQIHVIKCRNEAGREGRADLNFEYVSQRFVDKFGAEELPSPSDYKDGDFGDENPFGDPDLMEDGGD